MTPEGEMFAAAIDGQDGSSWKLPLQPLNATSTPEAYSPGENPPVDRLAAAARLVREEMVMIVVAPNTVVALLIVLLPGLSNKLPRGFSIASTCICGQRCCW
jgi:hypothetical protein